MDHRRSAYALVLMYTQHSFILSRSLVSSSGGIVGLLDGVGEKDELKVNTLTNILSLR